MEDILLFETSGKQIINLYFLFNNSSKFFLKLIILSEELKNIMIFFTVKDNLNMVSKQMKKLHNLAKPIILINKKVQ